MRTGVAHLPRRHVGIEPPCCTQLLRSVKQGAGIGGFGHAHAQVIKRRTTGFTFAGNLCKRGAGGGLWCRAQIKMGIKINDADALIRLGCGKTEPVAVSGFMAAAQHEGEVTSLHNGAHMLG